MSTEDDGKYYGFEGLKVSNALSTIKRRQQECYSFVQPRTAPPTTSMSSASNTQWEFQIPTGSNVPHFLHDHLLEFQINNADAVNIMGLVDGISMINTIETLINGTIVRTQYPQAMRNILILGNNIEKLATKLTSVGVDSTTYASNLSIPVSSSITVRVPFNTLLTTASFPMWCEKTKISIRFTMNGGATLIRTGAAVAASLSVTAASVRLILMGHRMEAELLQEFDRRLKMSPKTYKYLNAQQQVNGVAITAGNAASVNIVSLGWLSHYFFQVRVAVPVGVQNYDSYPLTSMDFLSSGSVVGSFMGDNALTTALLNIVADNFWPNVLPLAQRNLYWYSFTEDPIKDIYGSNHGSIPVTGQSETIRFTPTSTTDATAVCVFTGLYHARVTVDFNTGTVVVVRNSLDL